ncbi:MAG: hypothetical protein IT336_12530 [Thermomicrobiales bacterium]|nr:hypothetical protein [Thermomicrobiales bacterium]
MTLFEVFDELSLTESQTAGSPRRPYPATADTMLRYLSATSEGFAYGSTALAAALNDDRRATIAANMSNEAAGLPNLTCWRCRHDERGIDLVPLAFDAWPAHEPGNLDAVASRLIGDGRQGDVLIVCDPWGDNELLCWALRIASHRGLMTVAITTDQPNLLAALASHSVRVPVMASFQQEFVATALRFLVQTAGGALEARRRRTTQPLGPIDFS